MGARSAYSIMNALTITALCLSGSLVAIVWLIPVEAGITIIFWIGLIITAQAFETTEPIHYPAAIIGIMPGIVAWFFVSVIYFKCRKFDKRGRIELKYKLS